MTNLTILSIKVALNLVTLTYYAPFSGRATVDAKCGVNDPWTYAGWFNAPVQAGTNTFTVLKPLCGNSAYFRIQLTK